MVTRNNQGILALKEEYERREENLLKSMKSISPTIEGYERWSASRATYLEVIEDLEELLK